jgi:hypothetical protein
VIGLVSDAWHQRVVLSETGHRPWALPERSWLMGQTWVDLLFAHWRVPEEALRPLVPPEMPLDTHDGAAWLGVTPFCVRGLRLRGTLPAPLASAFPELNVRTYVNQGQVQRGDIHHPPWPLYRGWAEIEANTMARPFGIELEGEPLLHFSPRQDVVIWPLQPVT